MNEQEINIAIAEACGWTNVAHNTVFSGRKIGRGVFGNSPSGGEYRLTPNYCNDLNAMHEAEKLIDQQCKHSDYWFFVRQICDFPDAESDWDRLEFFSAIHATARQRAEAFLRTIGKWEEAK